MDHEFLAKVKLFLEVTARKTGIFLILFIVAFSLYGSVLDGVFYFALFSLYTYFMACVADKRIVFYEKKNVPLSIKDIVSVGVIYLLSILVIIIL